MNHISAVVAAGRAALTTISGSLHRGDELQVVADARIDRVDGSEPPAGSSAEVIASAYARWGSDCASHLHGDFAFVVWDGRARTLYAARDHFGIRALHYRARRDGVELASYPHALFGERDDKRPDALAVSLFLIDGYEQDGYTLYRDVVALGPGEELIARDGTIRVRAYWEPIVWRQRRHRRDDDYVAEFAAVFRAAVACRARTSGRLGVEVSGGLDSSSVACEAAAFASAAGSPPPLLFHNAYVDEACDETQYSDAVAERLGLTVFNLVPKDEDTRPAPHRDQPDALYCPMFATFSGLVARARGEGVDVLLSGVGGDHVMDETGLECADALRELRLRDALDAVGITRAPLDRKGYRRLWSHGVRQIIPPALRRMTRPFRPARARDLLTPAAARRAHDHIDERHRRDERRPYPSLAARRFVVNLRRQAALVPMIQADLLAARSGVEMRYPYFDVGVTELMLSLPPEVRLRRGVIKHKPLLRRAMAHALPDLVLRRTDCGLYFGLLDRLMREHRPLVVELFRDSRLADLGVLDMAALRRALDDATQFDADSVALATCMELWLRSSWS
jgi:asparagine synthase (glutamine-hydrolysing)